ncbi:hypothetical protein [Pararhizobium mangrovi]|uniref:Uncharacterized protein n=1 Tax=Pararhizobium mangrovi TaxID=2590452 RepID=A0A506U7N7_9HYPH|nr:hypothetical protein [Pararhizobium mangrovi]TPW30432.1 hypothetical protein FJU11_05330 [Pararhizobium mangrovi]
MIRTAWANPIVASGPAVDLRRTRPPRASSLLAAAALALAVVATSIAHAQQNAPDEKTIAPFGSTMVVKQKEDGVDTSEILKAVKASGSAANAITELSSLADVHIVYIDKVADKPDRTRITKAADNNAEDVGQLQTALEANALTYAALNAQSISPSMIVGARVDGDREKTVVVYTKSPSVQPDGNGTGQDQ